MLWKSSPTRSHRRKQRGRRQTRQTILSARTGRSRSGGRGGRLRAALALFLLIALPLAAVAVLMLGARGLAHLAFSRNELFTLRAFEIQSDGRLSPALIREYGGVPDSGNLFALDVHGIRDRLERVPRVRQAVVVRRLPDTLVVRVSERVPLAQVQIPGQALLMTVDRDGHVLGPGSTAPHLPVIDGLRQSGLAPGGVIREDTVRHALALLDICDRTRLGARLRIQRIALDDPDHMVLLLSGGEQVWMPPRDMERKLRELTSILWTIDDLRMTTDRSKVRVDMTTEERFPVQGLTSKPAS